MHAMLTAEDGVVLMAADAPKGMDYEPFNGTISLSGDDEMTLRAHWDKLVEGGTSANRSRRRRGATPSVCARTASASAGW